MTVKTPSDVEHLRLEERKAKFWAELPEHTDELDVEIFPVWTSDWSDEKWVNFLNAWGEVSHTEHCDCGYADGIGAIVHTLIHTKRS